MINVAIIGFGFMGITHALSIQRNPRLKLRAIITRDHSTIESKLQQQVGNFSSGNSDMDFIRKIPKYTSLEECMKHESLDAVHICVHTDLHTTIATEAIQQGLHVFLEKPISLDILAATKLVELAYEQDRKLMVGHVVRFMPAYQTLKSWIDGNEFGALKFISLKRFSGLPTWGQWKEKQKDFGSSGGALFDLLIHDIDFLNYVLGTPEKINATCLPGALSDHDYVNARWQYPSCEAIVEGGNIFHATFPFQASYMATFERASVVFSSLKPDTIQVCQDDKITEVSAGDANDGFYNEIEYFATCIEHDTPPLVCLPESSIQTIQLCYQHMDTTPSTYE